MPTTTLSPAYYDRTMWKDLQAASYSGRGVTKRELKSVVAKHANDGPVGELSMGEKNALRRTLARNLFATYKGAAVAKELADGQALSVIGIRTAGRVATSSAGLSDQQRMAILRKAFQAFDKNTQEYFELKDIPAGKLRDAIAKAANKIDGFAASKPASEDWLKSNVYEMVKVYKSANDKTIVGYLVSGGASQHVPENSWSLCAGLDAKGKELYFDVQY